MNNFLINSLIEFNKSSEVSIIQLKKDLIKVNTFFESFSILSDCIKTLVETYPNAGPNEIKVMDKILLELKFRNQKATNIIEKIKLKNQFIFAYHSSLNDYYRVFINHYLIVKSETMINELNMEILDTSRKLMEEYLTLSKEYLTLYVAIQEIVLINDLALKELNKPNNAA